MSKGKGYTLRDEGFPYLKIYRGREWVGRVFRHEDGRWIGMIRLGGSQVEKAEGATSTAAFEAVAAKRLGFSSATAVRQHNKVVRRKRAAARAAGRHVAQEMLRGNYAPFDALFGLKQED